MADGGYPSAKGTKRLSALGVLEERENVRGHRFSKDRHTDGNQKTKTRQTRALSSAVTGERLCAATPATLHPDHSPDAPLNLTKKSAVYVLIFMLIEKS